MKVQNITDVEDFFRVVEKCEGEVELRTSNGDRLSLKSKLCQYVSRVYSFFDDEEVDVEIIARNPDDAVRIFRYMQNE